MELARCAGALARAGAVIFLTVPEKGMVRRWKIILMLASASLLSSPENRLHRLFVDQLMPKVERHAEIYFRGVNCPTKRADKAAECVALAWRWFVRREERGKNVFEFPMAFCVLVAKAVHRAGVSVDVDGQHGSVRVCFGSELLRCLFYQRC